MKKISVLALSLLLCVSLVLSGVILNPIVYADTITDGEDTDIDINGDTTPTPTPTPDPEEPEELVVSLEEGADAGYLTNESNIYTATAYAGNKFLGWYKGEELLSANATCDFSGVTGNITAKFQNNNILQSPGFETLADGAISSDTSSTLFTIVDHDGWAKTTVVSDSANAYSGNKYLQMGIAWRTKAYLNLTGLQTHTYYKISYKYKATPGKATSYRGIIAGPSTVADIDACRKNALGQRILNNSDTVALTDGVWYTEHMEFFTDGYTDVRIFFGLGSGSIIIDELTVYKADALDADTRYTVSVTAENGTAYASKTNDISLDEEIIVNAVGNVNTTFKGWYEGDTLVSTSVNYVFKVNANRSLKAVFTKNQTESPFDVKFDLNDDGSVTEDDATLILNHILQKATLTKDADFNKDGKISVSDIVILRNNFYTGKKENVIREEILAGTNQEFYNSAISYMGDSAPVANYFKSPYSSKLRIMGSDITYSYQVKDYLETALNRTIIEDHIYGDTLTSSMITDNVLLGIENELIIVDLSVNDTAADNQSFERILRKLKDNGNAVIVLMQESDGATNKEAQMPVALLYNIPVIDIGRALQSTSAIDDATYTSNKYEIVANAINHYLTIVNDKKYDVPDTAAYMPMQFFYGNTGYVLDYYTENTVNLVDAKDAVLLNGRTYWNETTLGADWIGSGFTVSGNFSGEFKVKLAVTGESANIYAYVDNDYYNPNNIILDSSSGTFTIANLTPGIHTVQLFKATEPRLGTMTVESITYNGILYSAPAEKALKIQVYGDSITSGCALLTTEQEPNGFISQDGYKSYGNKTAMAFNADVSIMSRSGASVMTATDNLIQDFCYNTKYGVEGEWDYANNQADIVIIGLGTNDLNSIQNNPDGLKSEVKLMLQRLRAYNPNAHIIWVYGMMQTSKPEIFSGAVEELNDSKMHFAFLPRNADGGGGHPTNEGQRNATSTLVEYIRDNIL